MNRLPVSAAHLTHEQAARFLGCPHQSIHPLQGAGPKLLVGGHDVDTVTGECAVGIRNSIAGGAVLRVFRVE